MKRAFLAVGLGICVTATFWACGGDDTVVADGGSDGTTNDVAQNNDVNTQDTGGDTSSCADLKCARDPSTTISGVVYDPAGKRTIYNAIVYVPNAKPDAITNGASCDRCGSVSGDPVATALTDASGAFKLTNAPVGTAIPLVIQIGKWRRQVTIPAVTKGVDNAVSSQLTHLPRKASEGDMPLIAMASGCDPIECTLRKFGIDDSEFTVGSGAGHVRIFAGANASTVTVGTDAATAALAFWQNTTDLPKYDILVNACDCNNVIADKTTAYANVQAFLDKGGRVLGSHYAFDFFAPPRGPLEFTAAAQWNTNVPTTSADFIDTKAPKGKGMSDWLAQNLGGTAGQASIDPNSIRTDIGATYNATSRWIFETAAADGGGTSSAKYISFNTPTLVADAGTDAALSPAQQCGRGSFVDYHTINASGFGGSTNHVFPSLCGDYETAMNDQEYSFEFAFFELDSCIQDESAAPAAPPAAP